MRVSEYFVAVTIAIIIVGGVTYMFVFGRTHPTPPRVPKTEIELQAEIDRKITEGK